MKCILRFAIISYILETEFLFKRKHQNKTNLKVVGHIAIAIHLLFCSLRVLFMLYNSLHFKNTVSVN